MEKISIIICHHKGKLIDKAVDSLLLSRDVDFEIIIASSDQDCVDRFSDRKKITSFFCLGGPAKKRNVAFRYAQYPYIAFFDDDIEVNDYTLVRMLEALKEPNVGMVYGKLLNMEFRDRFDEAGSFLTFSGFLWSRAASGTKDIGQYTEKCPVLAGKSAACMIHRKIFSEVGLFDASYEILGEETDLSWRVWLYGYKVIYVPSSVTFHAFNTKFKPADFYIPRRVYFNGARNYLNMLTTNLEIHNLIIPLTIQISVWAAASVGMFLTGKFEAGYYIMKGIAYYFTHLRPILLKRSQVQSKRKVRDNELFPFIRRSPKAYYYIHRFFHYLKTGLHG